MTLTRRGQAVNTVGHARQTLHIDFGQKRVFVDQPKPNMGTRKIRLKYDIGFVQWSHGMGHSLYKKVLSLDPWYKYSLRLTAVIMYQTSSTLYLPCQYECYWMICPISQQMWRHSSEVFFFFKTCIICLNVSNKYVEKMVFNSSITTKSAMNVIVLCEQMTGQYLNVLSLWIDFYLSCSQAWSSRNMPQTLNENLQQHACTAH